MIYAAVDTFMKGSIKMYYSDRVYRRVMLSKKVVELMRATEQSEDVNILSLNFSQATEIVKLDILNQIKESFEDKANSQ